MRYILLPLIPLVFGALASLAISVLFGPYWWTLLPTVAGVGILFAKGKGERAERFDDKKQTTPERREELYQRVFQHFQTGTGSSAPESLISTSIFCSGCGLANPVGANFCVRCGARLIPMVQAQPAPQGQVGPSRPWHETAQVSYAGKQGVSRTETGLLLLIIGILLGPIPYASYVGGILAIVGAIMVIMGRQVFGDRHSRFVIASLVIYLVGLAAIVANTIGLAFSLFSAGIAGTPTLAGQAFADAFNQFLIGTIIASAITGIAVLLFTYALQNLTGKVLLWTGYVMTLAVGILVFHIVGTEVTSAVQQAMSKIPPDFTVLIQLQGRIQLLQFLGLIPAVINATAYYLVLSRVKRGELPET